MELGTGNGSEWPLEELEQLIGELSTIRAEMCALERQLGEKIATLPEAHRPSAKNLLHYLALRRHDLRPLQERLASFGLSSLGRSEAQVSANLDAVLKVLYCLTGRPLSGVGCERSEFTTGRSLLEKNTAALLGVTPPGRSVRIMVTMPSEAASDYVLVRELLASGMNCMRINSAHDDEIAWARMIENLRRAERDLGKSCVVLIDVPGPKLRTGPTASAPGVIKVRPKRDRMGNIVKPAKIWLTAIEKPEPPASEVRAVLAVSNDWLCRLSSGKRIEFLDARGLRRSMEVTEVSGNNRLAESGQTSYLTSETVLLTGNGGNESHCRIGPIPQISQPIILKPGDLLDLVPSQDVRSPVRDEDGRYLQAPSIGVTLPEIFSDLLPGEKIWFDDGKIGGVIRCANPEKITVEITKARAKGEKLRPDKGINFPDSDLKLPALTAEDMAVLPFVARHADLLGYSFVRRPSDIHLLQTELAKLQGADPGIVLKIETRKAFESLPDLILAAMPSSRIGIMIARGDLAVECGYERTGELQEEIMWIAEAAHVPVIWATQVLEQLAKEGQTSRAEITDAAMAERAECVMLNKGPYVIEAVKVLDDVLRRMQRHQAKKSALLRPLTIAENFVR
jgi:pyruvate kinase